MKNTPLLLTAIFMAVLINNTYAQNPADRRKQMADSIRRVYLTEAAISNPVLRQGVISVDFIPKSDITTFLNGNKLYEGKLRQERISALFNIPIKTWGKNAVTGTISYFQQRLRLSELNPVYPELANLNGQTINRQSVGFTGSFIRRDSLFGRQVIYSASISGLTSESGSVDRVSYLGGVIFTLKQARDRRSSLGLLVNIDPFLKTPVIPVYTYWRKYKSGTELNVNLPQQIMIRKPFTSKFYGTFGSSLAGTMAFASYDQSFLPGKAGYNTLDIKTGPGLEYRFAKIFMFGVNAGLMSPIQTRGFDINKDASQYFTKSDRSSSFYFNFTLSLLPIF